VNEVIKIAVELGSIVAHRGTTVRHVALNTASAIASGRLADFILAEHWLPSIEPHWQIVAPKKSRSLYGMRLKLKFGTPKLSAYSKATPIRSAFRQTT
jgi:hypothetical protein